MNLDDLRKIAEEVSPEYGMACLLREDLLALLDRVETAEQALQRVRELHTRDDGYCRACDRLYPCPTIAALEGDE